MSRLGLPTAKRLGLDVVGGLRTLPGWEGIPRPKSLSFKFTGDAGRIGAAVAGGVGPKRPQPRPPTSRAAVRVRAALEDVEKVLIRAVAAKVQTWLETGVPPVLAHLPVSFGAVLTANASCPDSAPSSWSFPHLPVTSWWPIWAWAGSTRMGVRSMA